MNPGRNAIVTENKKMCYLRNKVTLDVKIPKVTVERE